MKTIVNVLALCVLSGLVTACRAEDVKKDVKPPELKVVKVEKDAIKVDGLLDDAAWKKASVADDFCNGNGEAALGKTRLLAAQDEANLYIAIEGFEAEAVLKAAALIANAGKHDDNDIWQDDAVEVFIDPSGKRASYYQIIVNSKGVTWDAWHNEPKDEDKTWEPKYLSAVKIGEKSWVVELALPWACFDKTEKFEADWVFNAVRDRAQNGDECFWSPVLGQNAHAIERFGKLTGILGVKPPKAEAKPAEAAPAKKAE
jgi:hypothetical protein